MRPALAACFLLTFSLCALPAFAADTAKEKSKDKGKAKPAEAKKGPPMVVEVPKDSPWGSWVEKDFPFFSTVLDAREAGEGFPKDNLTPRGLVLNLGHNLWACFDTDLLRIACIWEGEEGKPPVTPEALAPGSYHIAGQKTKDGQDFLPKPVGKVLQVSGIYPGVQAGEEVILTDPREASASKEEVGRGPAPDSKFLGVHLESGVPVLRYEVAGVKIQQRLVVVENEGVYRVAIAYAVGRHKQPLTLLPPFEKGSTGPRKQQLQPSEEEITVVLGAVGKDSSPKDAVARWPDSVETQGVLSKSPDAYVLDDIPLPVPNPWKRNVRLADIAFLNDQGEAAAVSFDGDVWLISGLKDKLEKVTWKRFASGLHEPMSIVAREKGQEVNGQGVKEGGGKELFVFDRSGIWKLVDTNGDKEADKYEMFCNLFTQTAETREFPNSMKLGPDGSFYISKGGQEGTTFGKHNGTVIRVAPDGKAIEVIGYGLRQPFIGVNPKTGLVTASDQQGNYVPSTPIHIIEKHHFYGHVPTIAPKEVYPENITEPMVWLPHPVNPSGATQVWLQGSKMGPVNDELIHVGYNRPELFRVLMNERFKDRPQAAVMTFMREFEFGPLNAHVNPADGQLYVIGFQVWGTTAKKLSSLVRVRYTDQKRVLLKEVTPTDKGLLLRFNEKLDSKLAADPASYSVERWNYRRTFDYGSPHLKLDGTTGQEWMTASSAYLSKDGLTVLVGIPDMKAGVHQMRIGWGLKSANGLKAENTAYFSPWELLPFDAKKEGFEDNLQVDLTPRAAVAVAMAKPTVEEGARLYQMIGCMACHSIDGTTVGKVGPSWRGIYGTERVLGKGGDKALADEAYLKESITNPSAKVVKGFEKFDTGMPIYAGILNESQIESLVMYIKSLK